jgi:hypothetical protein
MQQLDGYVAIKTCLVGFIDLGHTAATKAFDDFIFTELFSRHGCLDAFYGD